MTSGTRINRAFLWCSADEAHAYGFGSLRAAGLALRAIRAPPHWWRSQDVRDMSAVGASEEIATDAEKGTSCYSSGHFDANETNWAYRRGIAVVVLVGGMLLLRECHSEGLVVLLFYALIRPVAVVLGLVGARVGRMQRSLVRSSASAALAPLLLPDLRYCGFASNLAQRLSRLHYGNRRFASSSMELRLRP